MGGGRRRRTSCEPGSPKSEVVSARGRYALRRWHTEAFSFSWTYNSVVDGGPGAILVRKERKWSRQKNSMSSRRGRQHGNELLGEWLQEVSWCDEAGVRTRRVGGPTSAAFARSSTLSSRVTGWFVLGGVSSRSAAA